MVEVLEFRVEEKILVHSMSELGQLTQRTHTCQLAQSVRDKGGLPVLPLVLIAAEWHFMEGDEEPGSAYGRGENCKQYIGKI
jgi:hypothetical protein